MSLIQTIAGWRRRSPQETSRASRLLEVASLAVKMADAQPVNVATSAEVTYMAQHLSDTSPKEPERTLANPFAAYEAVRAQAEAFNRLGLFGRRVF